MNINNLINSGILKEYDEYIEFYYPMIQKKWEECILNNRLSDSVILAADKCFTYYCSKLPKDDIKKNTMESQKDLHILLRIITRYIPEHIIYVMKYLEFVVKDFISPEYAKHLIELLVNELRKNKEDNIYCYYYVIDL